MLNFKKGNYFLLNFVSYLFLRIWVLRDKGISFTFHLLACWRGALSKVRQARTGVRAQVYNIDLAVYACASPKALSLLDAVVPTFPFLLNPSHSTTKLPSSFPSYPYSSVYNIVGTLCGHTGFALLLLH